MSIYGGQEDDDVPREHLEAWAELTTGSVSLKVFPGDHFFVNTAQTALLRTLSQELVNKSENSAGKRPRLE
jgi:medium-chain acyl-[acyl-carrier-protein] hydrolase